jgi:hypothetical protein
MVTIKDIRVRENSTTGETFVSLIVESDLELIKSETTGRYYATAKTASISSTFDEETAKRMIGKTLPGCVVKRDSEPYEYTIPSSGEVVMLRHRYEYVPMESNEAAVFVEPEPAFQSLQFGES